MRVSKTRYDVIVGDLFHPARDGAGTLYTREHFEAIKKRLNPNGLFCQWLPTYQLDLQSMQSIVRTFLEVYPHVVAYVSASTVHNPPLALVGSLTPFRYDAAWVERRQLPKPVLAELKGENIASVQALLGSLVAGEKELADFSASAPVNTDDWPIVMFRAPSMIYDPAVANAKSYARLQALVESYRVDPKQLIEPNTVGAEELVESVRNYIRARDILFKGLIAGDAGDANALAQAIVTSVRHSSHFDAGYTTGIEFASRYAASHPEPARRLLEALAAARPERNEAQAALRKLGLK